MVSVKATVMVMMLLTICLLTTNTSAEKFGCCRSYIKFKLNFNNIKGYSVQNDTGVCHISAIIFHTKGRNSFCANPALDWVMDYVNRISVSCVFYGNYRYRTQRQRAVSDSCNEKWQQHGRFQTVKEGRQGYRPFSHGGVGASRGAQSTVDGFYVIHTKLTDSVECSPRQAGQRLRAPLDITDKSGFGGVGGERRQLLDKIKRPLFVPDNKHLRDLSIFRQSESLALEEVTSSRKRLTDERARQTITGQVSDCFGEEGLRWSTQKPVRIVQLKNNSHHLSVFSDFRGPMETGDCLEKPGGGVEEEEEEDTRGKAAYADNALCLRNSDFIGWIYPPRFMASNNLFIWTNSQIGALMLTQECLW
ncbi:C-C motif chemokine 20 [Collichthys lucidus]|uniref:C-C motif chemokine n=1 Tax=Collichthys lucidus TaxID=240159 RepID=A0A4V6AQC5_COLLU|nr:C-C motif chemokine 20 [Collichthys lucidus]